MVEPRPLIVSHVPGRLRLRRAELRAPAANAAATAVLSAWEGVLSAEGKPACAGVVLRYDPALVAPAELEERLTVLFPPPEPAPVSKAERGGAGGVWSLKKLNRPAKIGSLAALAGSLLALSAGKSLHAALGIAHVAFLAVHLANHRKKILQ